MVQEVQQKETSYHNKISNLIDGRRIMVGDGFQVNQWTSGRKMDLWGASGRNGRRRSLGFCKHTIGSSEEVNLAVGCQLSNPTKFAAVLFMYRISEKIEA